MLELFELGQPVQAIEGGYFVALGEGGVVKDGFDEIIEPAAERHHGLADMD